MALVSIWGADGSLLAATSCDKGAMSIRIWNFAVGKGLFGKFKETTTTFLRQWIDRGGFSRLGDEIGDGSELGACSFLG